MEKRKYTATIHKDYVLAPGIDATLKFEFKSTRPLGSQELFDDAAKALTTIFCWIGYNKEAISTIEDNETKERYDYATNKMRTFIAVLGHNPRIGNDNISSTFTFESCHQLGSVELVEDAYRILDDILDRHDGCVINQVMTEIIDEETGEWYDYPERWEEK